MRVLRIQPNDPNDYCCNIYWVVADPGTPNGLNTLVDVGSSRPANLAFMLQRMEEHPKGIGVRAVDQVILTHCHYDHTGGLPGVMEHFSPKVLAFCQEPWVDQNLVNGDWLRIGDKDFRVIHTPGHSEDSICLFCPETKTLFSGDTLYRITDTEGCYPECYATSLERLLSLDAQTVLPGHGEPVTHGIKELITRSIQCVRNSAVPMREGRAKIH